MLSGINQILKAGLKSSPPEKICKIFLENAVKLTSSNLGFICRIKTEGELSITAIVIGGEAQREIDTQTGLKLISGLSLKGFCALVLSDKKTIVINNIPQKLSYIDEAGLVVTAKRFLGHPVNLGRTDEGVAVLTSDGMGYESGDREIIAQLAEALADALSPR